VPSSAAEPELIKWMKPASTTPANSIPVIRRVFKISCYDLIKRNPCGDA
jgi:hypothetical protein